MDRRAELADYLRARRAAVQPGDVGLPSSPRRRTKGLRREEVAMLAGVSVTWYTWLEQGRRINASREVLESLGRALCLDAAGRDHLLTLAALGPAPLSPSAADLDPPDALVDLLDSLTPAPAYILGPRWEFVAWNRPQALLYPAIEPLEAEDRNLAWVVYARSDTRALIVDWEAEARLLLAELRSDLGQLGHDETAAKLVTRLRAASAQFDTWWNEHDVARFRTRLRRYRHPRAGELVFQYQVLTPAEWPHLRVAVQLPVPGDDSAQRLSAWHDVV